MGLLDFLGAATNVATGAAGAQQMGQYEATMMQRNQAIQAAMLARQMRQEQNMEEYRNAMAAAAYGRRNYYDWRTEQPPKPPNVKTFQGPDGGEWWMDPTTHQAFPVLKGEGAGPQPGPAGPAAQAPGGPAAPAGKPKQLIGRLPPPPNPYGNPVVTVDAQGNRTYAVPSRKDASITETTVAAPQPNGTNAMSAVGIKSQLDQARTADQEMRQYEEYFRAHPNEIGTGTSMAAGAAGVQNQGIVSGAEKGLGNWALGRFNPRYQKYLTAQKKFGNAAANLQTRRYTEHQGQLEQDLSGLSQGDIGPTIDLKQQLRQELLNAPLPGGQGGGSMNPGVTQPPPSSGRGGGPGSGGRGATNGATTGSPQGTGVAQPPPNSGSGDVLTRFNIKPYQP